jgi:hypothetical protein
MHKECGIHLPGTTKPARKNGALYIELYKNIGRYPTERPYQVYDYEWNLLDDYRRFEDGLGKYPDAYISAEVVKFALRSSRATSKSEKGWLESVRKGLIRKLQVATSF